MTQKFPWSELMRLGIHQLQLSPEKFWRSTLRELRIANPASSMSRQTFLKLMQTYKDQA